MLEYQWLETLSHIIEGLIQLSMIGLELMGAAIIVYGAVLVFSHYFRLPFRQTSTDIRIRMARALALGLEFYLAAEIFKTVTVREVSDLIVIGVIVFLRSVIAVLIHWEIRHDLEELREDLKELQDELDD